MTKHLIEINNLNFKYENNIILNNISFNITKNENIGILGRNGGGKSTLIKILLGFLKPASGSVKYNIDRKKIGYLPSKAQRDEVARGFDAVIGGGFAVAKNSENLIFVAPFAKNTIPKDFRERCREAKIPEKIRGYLHTLQTEPRELKKEIDDYFLAKEVGSKK